jgi:hypothetical protein
MKEVITGLLSSKKVLTGVIASVTSFLVLTAAKHGYALTEEQAMFLVKGILAVAAAVIAGQGLADFGKEKAKIEATLVAPEPAAPAAPASPQPPSS